MRHQPISKQSFKIITQYGDMLVVRQGAHGQTPHHHHAHHHPVNLQQQQQQQQPQQPGATTGAANEQQQQQQQQQSASQQHQPSRPIIMTFHDLGLNSELQFANFCESDEVKLMLQTFTMIHVNFIGQEFEPTSSSSPAASLPDEFKYPTVEQMAECIVDICAQLRVRSFVGLAVGAGAYIVSTLALIRPDLVHGLFLINPVISSCSITEWLYFKMSAFASNHNHILHNAQNSSSGSNNNNNSNCNQHQRSSGSISLAGSTGSGSSNQVDESSHSSRGGPKTGLKRIWNAVHHHHPSETTREQHDESERPRWGSSGQAGCGSEADLSSRRSGESGDPSGGPNARLSGSNQSLGKSKPAAGSRLRNLILSRNFLHSKHQQGEQMSHSSGEGGNSRKRLLENTNNKDKHHLDDGELDERPQSSSSRLLTQDETIAGQTRGQKVGLRRSSSVSSPGGSSQLRRPSVGSSRSSSNNWLGKRPPFEYLMYHHFGSVSFQRMRRLSSESGSELLEQAANRLAGDSPKERPSKSGAVQQQRRAQASMDESARLDQAGPILVQRLDEHRASSDSSNSNQNNQEHERGQSQESLVYRSRRWNQRSSSVCLSPTYLASIASERQRASYMQAVYRQYFCQLNSHNLWLFAQSFAKRKTLNLRKDCGAAAHAAAAAAALGTSICVAFAGLGPVGAGGHELAAGASLRGPTAAASAAATVANRKDSSQGVQSSQGVTQAQSAQSDAAATSSAPPETAATAKTTTAMTTTPIKAAAATTQTSKPQQQQALVAGTKVKRTFTCQTLIMCSSVHIHRDRALKLMSLLNPLQATWIKTDQLLVLDEKPEKVCQAMRLFLQGIGYSMSTHERRLRLCSAQASISSADSNGSVGSAGPPEGTVALESGGKRPKESQKEAAALQERTAKMST